MKIKYGEIEFYSSWLLENLSLVGKRNRMRVKFIDILNKEKIEFNRYHIQLIKEHSRLDENESPIVLDPDENGNGRADIIDLVAFNKEFFELQNEEFTIEENEQNRDMLTIVRDCVEECPIAWSGEDACRYELVCRLFDNIYSKTITN